MNRRITRFALTNPPYERNINREAGMERMREQGPPTRRDIVLSAAAGAGALLAGKTAGAQAARSPGRIDLHHHYFPPAFLHAQRDAAVGLNRPAGPGAALEGWAKAGTIETKDRYGIP